MADLVNLRWTVVCKGCGRTYVDVVRTPARPTAALRLRCHLDDAWYEYQPSELTQGVAPDGCS